MKDGKKRFSFVMPGALLMIIVIVLVWKYEGNRDSAHLKNAEAPTKSTDIFDSGRLELLGSIEYEGPNFEESSMTNGIYTLLKVRNISNLFLRNAKIEVEVNQSEKMVLMIDSLPAGETVAVIGQGHESYSENDIYKVISCESVYEKAPIAEKEGLEVSYKEGNIYLTNRSGQKMNGITCRYKGRIDEMLFGGITYEFKVDSLSAGEVFETANRNFLVDNIQIIEIKE